MYIEILVCYDITSNKARRKLVKELKDMGLQNVQESVFWGRVLPAELKSVQRVFDDTLTKGEDKAFILKANFATQIKNLSFGYDNPELYEERDYEIF